MKKILLLSGILFLVSCSTVEETSLKADEPCGIPELTGKSCVEPNHDEIAKHPFGLSGHNPVRSDGVRGQREYLSRLICPDRRAVKGFSRSGSVGIGPYGFMLDLYQVQCRFKTYSVFMDLYHPGYIENRPVDGFTIKH